MSNLMEMESGKVFDSHKETLGSMLREGARLISVAQRKKWREKNDKNDERKRSSFFTNVFNREWEFAAPRCFWWKNIISSRLCDPVCVFALIEGKPVELVIFYRLADWQQFFCWTFLPVRVFTFLRYTCYHEQGLFGLISRAQILNRNFFNRLLIQARSSLDMVEWNFL